MKKVITLLMAALSSANLVAQNENLQPGDKVTITNPGFEDGETGWATSSGWWYTDSYESFGACGISYSETFDFNQTITGLPNGIYLLKATACDRIRQNTSEAVSAYNPNTPLYSYIYINDMQSSIKSLVDDRVSTNIYLKNGFGYTSTSDGCFVYDGSYDSKMYAFSHGLYENYVLGVVTDGTLKIGIRHNDNSRYTYVEFDNFEVTYLSESTDLETYATGLLEQPMSSDSKSALQAAKEALNVVVQKIPGVIDFEDANSYLEGWTFTGKSAPAQVETADGKHYLSNYASGGAGYMTYTVSNTSYLAADVWKVVFEYNLYTSNSKESALIVKGVNHDTIFYATNPSWSTDDVTVFDAAGNQIGTFKGVSQSRNTRGQSTCVAPAHIITLDGETDGIYLTIATLEGSEEIARTKVQDYDHVSSIDQVLGNQLSAAAFNDIAFSPADGSIIEEVVFNPSALPLFYDKLGKAETSVQTYAKLGDFLKTLSATSLPKNIWPQTIADAKAVAEKYVTAYNNATLTDNDVINALVLADDFKERINYTYLNIAVTTPGTMGDSILAKTENFSDVQSLKLSGKLNDEDISTLKSRLTSLVELDLSDLDWTDIPAEQFRDKTELRRVVLPNNVATIGDYAFYNCQKLQQMEFPASLRSIGYRAFYRTYNIGKVALPEGLVTLGNECFEYSRLTSVSFPSTLKNIPYECFYDCEYMREIFFNGQTDIRGHAFSSCRRLSSVKFPETLKTIGYYAFNDCYALRDIEFNEGLTQIGHYAFANCDSLKAVTLPSSLQALYDKSYSSSATFYDCDNLAQITCKAIVPPYIQSGNITSKSGLDLYVPLLSVNVYKQATGWDQFNIHGINIMPDNIVVNSDYKLNWPDSLNIDYKPNVSILDFNNTQYGSLTVTGNSTLSAAQFTMKYDPNITYNDYYWDNERQEYYRNRFAYTSLVNEATVRADNVTLELWLRANSWEFLTVPYDIKVSDIRMAFEGTPFVIRKYDGGKRAAGMTGATWVEMTADSTLHAGVGYIWRSASTDNNRNYTGFYLDALQTVNKNNIFANSDLEIPLAYYESEFEHNRSWNLIGNPYPCFYDIRAMRTSAPITVWDTYQNNYRAYSPEDDSYILNPGQAFFVQRPVDEESIVFLKEGRQKNLTIRDIEYGGSTNAKSLTSAKAQRSVFNVRLNNGEQGDFTRFVINPEATMQYDAARDASKFMSIEKPAAQLYTIEGDVRYAINERPLSDGNIILGMQIATEGLYTITLDTKADAEVYLVDNLLGQEVRMDGNTEGYAFQSAAGTFENRFSIRIGGKATGIETVENSEASASSGLYDLQGRRVSELQKGVYLKSGKKVIVK